MNDLMPKQEMTIDSREIAEIIKKRHADLMRDIRTYIEQMKEANKDNAKLHSPNLVTPIKPTDYFIESTYKNTQNKVQPCYLLTKIGCEFVSNKLTGVKGTAFTAMYTKRFNDMEQTLKEPKKQITPDRDKNQLIEARLRNAKARQANILLKMADSPIINDRYKQILYSQASAIIADKPLIPLPVAEEQTYSAGKIGELLGISGNKVGRLANEYNLKTEKYGKLFHDKSKYSNKEVETFRYYESVVPVLKKILG